MKRLDKPTKHDGDNLLNIEKKAVVPLNLLQSSQLSEYLKAKLAFYWSRVSQSNKPCLWQNHAFHIHLKPAQKIRVKGEIT
jgi:hypothetical protein